MKSLSGTGTGIAGNSLTAGKKNFLPAIVLLVVSSALSIFSNGRITLLDLVCVFLASLSFPSSIKNPFLRPILISALVIGIVQNLSDLINGTKFLSVPGFFGYQIAVLTAGLYWLHKEKGISVGAITLSICFGMSILQVTDGILIYSNLWKYNFGFAITLSCFIIAHKYSKSPAVHFFLGIYLSIINYVNDFRAGFFATLLYAFLSIRILTISKNKSKLNSKKNSSLSLISQFILFILFAVALFSLYPVIALDGYLGERVQRQQVSLESNGLGNRFILINRPEFPFIVLLAAQSPILGYGSYGSPSGTQIYKSLEYLSRAIPVNDVNFRRWLLAADPKTNGYNLHSRLGSTLIAGGFFTLFFWLIYFSKYSRLWFLAWKNSSLSSNLLGFILFFVFWDSLFSPPTQTARYEIALFLFLGAIASENQKISTT